MGARTAGATKEVRGGELCVELVGLLGEWFCNAEPSGTAGATKEVGEGEHGLDDGDIVTGGWGEGFCDGGLVVECWRDDSFETAAASKERLVEDVISAGLTPP